MSFGWFLALPLSIYLCYSTLLITKPLFLNAFLYVRLPILHYQTRLGLLQRT